MIELQSHFARACVNEVSVRNVNDPMPTGQGDIGTILLSPFGDEHYYPTQNHHQQQMPLKHVTTTHLKLFECLQRKGRWI